MQSLGFAIPEDSLRVRRPVLRWRPLACVLFAFLFGCGDSLAPGSGSDADPRARIREIAKQPDALTRAEELSSWLSSLEPQDAPAIGAIVKDAYSGLRPIDVMLLLEFWARHEPDLATRWAVARADVAYRGAAVWIAAGQWARQDPLAVVEKYGSENDDVSRALIPGWFDSGVPGLEDFVLSLGPTAEGQRAISLFVRETIARDGAEKAMEWARATHASRAERLAIHRQVGSELAMADPARAVAWCDEVCAGPYGDSLRAMIARRWAVSDPAATMAWVQQSAGAPPRELRQAARSTFRSWIHSDKEQLLAWARSIPESDYDTPWMEPIISMYVAVVSWTDPHDALEWAKWIRDDKERELAYVTIARRWRDLDEESAEAWLQSSPLSAEARARSREYPKGYRGKKRDGTGRETEGDIDELMDEGQAGGEESS